MLRAKLLAATAVVSMMAAPAFAQEATQPAPVPAEVPATDPAMPTSPEATGPVAQEAAPTAEAVPTESAETPAASSVIDVLKSSGQFTTLLSALDAAQLTETLATRPAISIFAPTDAAFAALPEAERTRLLDPANADELRQILLYHVIVADVTPDQIQGRKGGVPTAAESQVLLDGTGTAIKADGATVVSAELDAGNGAIFPIDQVLNPASSLVAMGDEEAAAPAEEAAPAEAAAPAETAAPVEEAAPVEPTPTEAAPVDPAASEVTDPAATPPVEATDPAEPTEETPPTPQ